MSSRAIRRLRQEQQEALTSLEDDDVESDDEPEQKAGFLDMLDESDEDESSDDDSHEDDDVRAAPQIVKAANTVRPSQEKEEEDIDAILSSFHNERSISHSESADATPTLRSLLLSPSRGYDVQSLDLDHAVRSLLGGANVGGEVESRQRGKGRSKVTAKKYLFGRPRETWGKPPSYVGGGLGCKELTKQVLEEERNSWTIPWPYNNNESSDNADHDNLQNQKWYTLIMSDTYQEQQYAYHQLLRRNTHHSATLEDPNALAMFVADHPHYAETLLQLSMVLYHVNERGRGNDLLRRTMYLYETALPSSVLPNSTGSDNEFEIFMDADRPPNQGLFATLFRIMQTSGMTGCHANALSTGRFLLSLDPLRDPMGVLLILDYYALACRSSILEGNEMGASFIKELVESGLVKIHYKDPLTSRHWCCELRDMPGWAFSYALALYRLANTDECEDETMQQMADVALVEALTKFPLVLPKLLAMNKVNTQDRSFIMDWHKLIPFFTTETDDVAEGSVQDRVTKGAGIHLVRIFVQRHYKLWSGDDVIQWLYRCAEKVVANTAVTTSTDDENTKNEVSDTNPETENRQLSPPQSNAPHLLPKFHPALARYAQFDPSEYEDAFRTLPPEAIALDPNIIAPAMEFNPNRRGRFLRRGQVPEEMPMEGGHEGFMNRLREALGMGVDAETEMLDPDSPLLQLYLQSLLPWNQVEGVRPPR